jgi:hypothetical protein
MAPVLQCPDCGTKHPIDLASSAAAFRCNGCGRTLKVPAAYRPAPAPTPSGPTPSDATAVVPAVGGAPVVGGAPQPSPPSTNGGRPLSRRKVRAQAGVVPFWMRLLVWLIAVPLGFALVFGVARLGGFLTQTQLEDVFLDTGWSRFWPVARLLPFVALVTASIVHFSVLWMSRWRVRHAMRPLQPKAPPPREPRPVP